MSWPVTTKWRPVTRLWTTAIAVVIVTAAILGSSLDPDVVSWAIALVVIIGLFAVGARSPDRFQDEMNRLTAIQPGGVWVLPAAIVGLLKPSSKKVEPKSDEEAEPSDPAASVE